MRPAAGSRASTALAGDGTIEQVREEHAALAEDCVTGERARVAGLLCRIRQHGGISSPRETGSASRVRS